MSPHKGICAVALAVALYGCGGTPYDAVPDRAPLENRTRFDFPVGYIEFHDNEGLNFMINRVYSMGYARQADLVAAASEIESLDDWKVEMVRIAENAVAENRLMNAAFYYRMAEFYTPWNDPDKGILYERFIHYFHRACDSDGFQMTDIPYHGSIVPTLKLAAVGERRGTILLHGGYDGFKEELYSVMTFLSSYGYDVIGFDVPWMGRARTATTGGLDYEWEKLVAAILDHYELDDVSIFGLSMGGWLALRAAAFEPRIKRVIASSVSFDVNQYAGLVGQAVARFARKNMRGFANRQIEKQMESEPQSFWFFDHLMHVTNRPTPLEAADVLAEINEENLHSDRVTQDVLILTGSQDHLVPLKMQQMQVDALVNAASVTPLVFTEDVSGQNHCQVGNLGLALSVVVEWLESI